MPARIAVIIPARYGSTRFPGKPLHPMAGKPGIRNLPGMRGRRKGGLAALTLPPADPIGLHSRIECFIERLEARAYSASGVESHRWALKQFLVWAEGRGIHRPEPFTRMLLEEYQLFLFHYRSPKTGRPLATNTQLERRHHSTGGLQTHTQFEIGGP